MAEQPNRPNMDYDHQPFVDDLFLPLLFIIFTSSLVTVLHVCYFVKLLKESLLWRRTMTLLLSLSVIAFVLQATSSWKKDFLHQVGLIQTSVLWQRVLSGFIMANKLTIDTTENYWITSQLISFVLPLVAFVNMQRKHACISFFVVCGYLCLGLTGSHGGMFALFLYHLYNSNSTSFSIQELTFGQHFSQLISSIGGCIAIIFLGGATLIQLKMASFPILFTIFVLPFASSRTSLATKSSSNSEKNLYASYFFILLGLFLTLYHFYLTYLVLISWLGFKVLALVAFGHAYQYAITVDVISCMVVLSAFITFELYLSDLLKLDLKYGSVNWSLKVLAVFLCVALLTLIISPGGLFALFIGCREHWKYKDVCKHLFDKINSF